VPPEFDFALKVDPPAYDPKRAKQLLAEAGYPNGFEAGDLTPLPPYTSLAEEVGNFLGEIGIRASVRNMERATFMSSWHDKKLRGLLIGATGAAGNAAARLEPFMTKGGLYAYGSLPEVDDLFQRQARELDRGKREALLHQIQKIVTDQVLAAPIFQQGFICGVGPRVAEPALGLIQGFPYAGPVEDLRLKWCSVRPRHFVRASMPAWAVWASCWEVTPDTPIDPMILPSWTIGMPPSRTLKPVDRKRRFTPPWAMPSCRTLVGRRSATAERAFSLAMSMLPHWVLSSRCIITICPPESRTTMATGQPFFFASASAPATTFLACSRLIGGP